MSKELILSRAEKLIKARVSTYDSGHDWWHIVRVRNLAKIINEKENLEEPFLVDLAALFHDFADSKFNGTKPGEGYEIAGRFLAENGMENCHSEITGIMRNVSFSSRKTPVNKDDSLLCIIQDADRLDAIGAIGIARAFSYGGYRNNIIYSPVAEENSMSTINHFYEKLLLLSAMMNTETGKKMAHERHVFLEIFLDQFHKEWNAGSF
ncbi:MAG TPA: HD domain-containing protein [Bacteroidales bacterium]|nr:HD domain-containing protein [Bacteroidales bacterium]